MSILLASSRILSRQLLVRNVTKTIKYNSILQKAFISFGNGLKQKNMLIQDIKIRPGETIDDKNIRLKRPLSPHLTVYRPQLTSIMSILHRIGGFVLSCYLFWFAVSALVMPEKYDYYMDQGEEYYKKNFPNWSHHVPKLMIAVPFIYHFINGIRHLLFDLALFLQLPQVYMTGAIVIFLFLIALGTSVVLPQILYDIEEKAEAELQKHKKK